MVDKRTLDECLSGISFPASKDEVSERAAGNTCPADVLGQLRDIQVTSYRSEDEVLLRMVAVSEGAKEKQRWLPQDPGQEREWLRQNNLIYGALIAVGVYMVQPFLTASSLDLSAGICVVAFAVAIPLLAALVMVNRQETFRGRRLAAFTPFFKAFGNDTRTTSPLVPIAQVVAQTCAFVGVVAGFWHILWIAGVAMLATGVAAVAVYAVGYTRLERDEEATHGPGEVDGAQNPPDRDRRKAA